MNNSERLVVITGGTKGIGRALVECFAREGWAVATCARNEADLNQLKSTAASGQSIFTKVADLSKRKDLDDFITFIEETGMSVEVLINNTGVFIPGMVTDEEEGVLEQMIQTNLYSAYYVTRGIVPQMIRARRGHIFNMCSVASLKAYPNGGSYSISKFALYGFSQALREELKEHNVRVTSVLPGAVKTPSWDGVDLPDDRFMKPEDIAETILAAYQLSDRTLIEDVVLRPQLGDI